MKNSYKKTYYAIIIQRWYRKYREIRLWKELSKPECQNQLGYFIWYN